MRLSALLSKINIEEIVQPAFQEGRTGPADPFITSLAYDSREVTEGSLFFALKGLHVDGHRFIGQAIGKGAAAVVCMEIPEIIDPRISYVRVADSRTVMSPIAADYYGHPSLEMVVIGVTGTDGKSTTSYFIQQLLRKSGKKTGLLTTVQFDLGSSSSKNYLRQSTPEATEIHRLLWQMRNNGCTHAVVEATSHGLSPRNNRLGDVRFDTGVLTNISHEHLDFHKTLEQYIDDKANLFRALPAEGGCAVVNLDEPRRNAFEQAAECPVFTYSLTDGSADLYAADIRPLTGEKSGGQEFTLVHAGERSELTLPLTGRFNVENCLAALLAVSSRPGEDLATYLPFVGDLEAIRGRMVPVQQGQPFQVIVDYAHTPGSFRKLFPSLRSQVEGKLIAVFGSAGERDIDKRSIQGKIASEFCDIIILADEDPRGEEPLQILEDIAEGCRGMERGKNLLLIEDRPAAIRTAFSMAGKDDLVILLGKGHEGSIIYADGPVPWDEEQEAIKALRESGYQI